MARETDLQGSWEMTAAVWLSERETYGGQEWIWEGLRSLQCGDFVVYSQQKHTESWLQGPVGCFYPAFLKTA